MERDIKQNSVKLMLFAHCKTAIFYVSNTETPPRVHGYVIHMYIYMEYDQCLEFQFAGIVSCSSAERVQFEINWKNFILVH